MEYSNIWDDSEIEDFCLSSLFEKTEDLPEELIVGNSMSEEDHAVIGCVTLPLTDDNFLQHEYPSWDWYLLPFFVASIIPIVCNFYLILIFCWFCYFSKNVVHSLY